MKNSKIKRTYYGKMLKGEFVPNERYLKLTKKGKPTLGIETEPDENIVEKALRKRSNIKDKKGATVRWLLCLLS